MPLATRSGYAKAGPPGADVEGEKWGPSPAATDTTSAPIPQIGKRGPPDEPGNARGRAGWERCAREPAEIRSPAGSRGTPTRAHLHHQSGRGAVAAAPD